jgi:hypothetical protein
VKDKSGIKTCDAYIDKRISARAASRLQPPAKRAQPRTTADCPQPTTHCARPTAPPLINNLESDDEDGEEEGFHNLTPEDFEGHTRIRVDRHLIDACYTDQMRSDKRSRLASKGRRRISAYYGDPKRRGQFLAELSAYASKL